MKKLVLILAMLLLLLSGCRDELTLTEKYEEIERNRMQVIRNGTYDSIDEALQTEMQIFEKKADAESLYYICDIISKDQRYEQYRKIYYYHLFEYMLIDEELVDKVNLNGFNDYVYPYLEILFKNKDKHWINIISNSNKYYKNDEIEVYDISMICATYSSDMNDEEFDLAFNKLLGYEKKYDKLFYNNMEKNAQLMLYLGIYVMAEERGMTEYIDEYAEKYKKQYKKTTGRKYDLGRVK